jgi:hypothetical protein
MNRLDTALRATGAILATEVFFITRWLLFSSLMYWLGYW